MKMESLPVSNKEKSFEKQFVEETITINGESISFTKVEAHNPITPQYVVLVGGFALDAKGYKAELKNLVDSGRNILFTNPLKGTEISSKDAIAMKEFNLPNTIQRKVAEVLSLLDGQNIKRADIVGHSQGAIIASVVSALRPGLADDLLLANPAGMHGTDTAIGVVSRTVKGLGKQTATNLKRSFTKKGELKRISNVVGNVIFGGTQLHKHLHYRFAEEIPGIVKSDLIPVLNSIKSVQSDIGDTKITLLTANEDLTFDNKTIEENIGVDWNKKDTLTGVPIDNQVMYIKKGAGHESLTYEEEGILKQILNQKFPVDKVEKR